MRVTTLLQRDAAPRATVTPAGLPMRSASAAVSARIGRFGVRLMPAAGLIGMPAGGSTLAARTTAATSNAAATSKAAATSNTGSTVRPHAYDAGTSGPQLRPPQL